MPDSILGFAAGLNVEAALVDFHNQKVDWSTWVSVAIAAFLLGAIMRRVATSTERP